MLYDAILLAVFVWGAWGWAENFSLAKRLGALLKAFEKEERHYYGKRTE